jgi:hypothetical protein
MNKPRIEDIIRAFNAKQRKRNKLLYEYYKESYFTGEYNAVYVAHLITQELGIEMTPNMVYKIRSRYTRPAKGPAALHTPQVAAKISLSSLQTETKMQGETREQTKKYVLKNKNEYPESDPYNGQMDDL